MRYLRFFVLALVVLSTLAAGCASLETKQREWIFQPSNRTWGGVVSTDGFEDVWITFDSPITEQTERLHGVWLPAADAAQAPVLLYLHGARWNVYGSANRIRRMQELGFSVLAIDYRGFGQSSGKLPSEDMAAEDAMAAWNWLGTQYPGTPRYIFGHSLGGAIAIDLAQRVQDEQGTLVEGTFTSIADVVKTFWWGWLPVSGLITQKFESERKVAQVGSPLLVVHGTADRLIPIDLGRKLYDAAQEPKRFVQVDGGSHHNTNAVGQPLYRQALREMFGWP
jgi:alpha-beta hydrolase superfamily lysophospholipase